MADIEKTAEALRGKGYEVSCFATGKEAAEYLNGKIDGYTVGFGDSETLFALGMYERLSKHNDVHDPMHRREGKGFFSTARDCLTTEMNCHRNRNQTIRQSRGIHHRALAQQNIKFITILFKSPFSIFLI